MNQNAPPTPTQFIALAGIQERGGKNIKFPQNWGLKALWAYKKRGRLRKS